MIKKEIQEKLDKILRKKPIRSKYGIKVGEYYQHCSYKPVLCTEITDYDLWGICLIDGVLGMGCSLKHCAPVKLTFKEMLFLRNNWKEIENNHYRTLPE
jgi:hypothetical protein